MSRKLAIVEPTDFVSLPPGGQTSVARALALALHGRVILVGQDASLPVGQLSQKTVEGKSFPFFCFGRPHCGAARPVVPARIRAFFSLWRYSSRIQLCNFDGVVTQAPEAIFIISRWRCIKKCYLFPGVENPLERSRFQWGRWFSRAFDRLLFSALRNVDVLMASADDRAIDGLLSRANSQGCNLKRPLKFPTRYDERIFYNRDRYGARASVSLPPSSKILVTVGRLNEAKGWRFLIDVLAELRDASSDNYMLVFVGDGEDRDLLERYANEKSLASHVLVTGFLSPVRVSLYMNAADVYVVGSEREGWSVAMIEALGCGKPIVSTDVSGAGDMVVPGRNGFVVDRNPEAYATAVRKALVLPDAATESLAIAQGYKMSAMGAEFDRAFESA